LSALTSARIDGPDDIYALFGDMCAKGLTDGLPVIPPTEQYVRAMLDYVGLPPEQEIAVIPPEGGVATVEKLAISAVMAGCLPEYFPVVIAAIKALAEPRFNLLGVQTTTNPASPVLVVNGPLRRQLDIACGRGCMGNGFRANATIGRAVKLALRNIGGCVPGDVSKSIHGMPGRYSFCFGELEEESPWEPFHVEMGFKPETSTVSVFGGQGTQNLYASYRRPESIIHMVADGMRCYGNNGYLRGSGNPLVVISPGHARVFAQHGWNKAKIKQELFAHTDIPLTQVAAEQQLAHPIYADWDRSRSIQLCRQAGDIVILVAGGAEAYHVTYIPSFASTDMVIQPIDVPQQ
jgi:hypothetical protein